MPKYTIAFLRRGEHILLLNRHAEPGMGLWNGVGGKLEPGETPLGGILREIAEETGIRLEEGQVSYRGTVTWTSEAGTSGMYAFIAELPADYAYVTPMDTPEGVLSWKHPDWIFHPANAGVMSNIPYFLPVMLNDQEIFDHQFHYNRSNNAIYPQTAYCSSICDRSVTWFL